MPVFACGVAFQFDDIPSRTRTLRLCVGCGCVAVFSVMSCFVLWPFSASVLFCVFFVFSCSAPCP
ncbi:unnamed protein product [Laminaria digitata]